MYNNYKYSDQRDSLKNCIFIHRLRKKKQGSLQVLYNIVKKVCNILSS